MASLDFSYSDPSIPMGVLERFFVPGRDVDTVVQMPSMRKLAVKVNDSSISVHDEEHWEDYKFIASMLEGVFEGKDAVGFHIDTYAKLGGLNKRHPDLFAARLLGRSVSFFENDVRGGRPLDRLWAQWIPVGNLSDNYDQYEANLRKRMIPENAARATWTGRQACALGFNAVNGIFMEDGLLNVYFDRP